MKPLFSVSGGMKYVLATVAKTYEKVSAPFLARLLIREGGLLQLKFGVGANIYLWAR